MVILAVVSKELLVFSRQCVAVGSFQRIGFDCCVIRISSSNPLREGATNLDHNYLDIRTHHVGFVPGAWSVLIKPTEFSAISL